MREAIKFSAVWFDQVLARRVGYEPIQKWIAKVDHGNQKIGNKDDIDKSCQLSTVKIFLRIGIRLLRNLWQMNEKLDRAFGF
ncbi:hypothetical protein QUB60_21590 [Microcoleus sp. A2-C5]|uniref:hypothetical protein n=1 Tax=Microcoleaceae TaxID=1892252 RepID=UPI002238CEA9|nr:hypothetical protein [Lyngbya sp. CCAP 1446/10]